ncbi:hypothetical protein [Rhodoferax saidenbachensis]|uniref:Uncharacterized protein n=1 Tax=Rhodoferax saidenbachensis TaxID=1484693 RepID=A0ABU1ZHF7_9BURK|nr:hypothetical protein [Rhodoferax saidenbachensis]MDR7304965.1 hypothetical protein [Rhodoferax saidenbachensis]
MKTSVAGVVLLCAAMGSSALTLGRARGAAILGQPLELTVPVQFAADEDSTGLCFEADVYYGENRQDSSRVTVTADTPGSGQPIVLRIASRLPVDEPVVTLYVRSACGVKASRKYVLLADLVSELAPPVAVATPIRPSVPAAVPPVAAVAPDAKPANAGNGSKSGKAATAPRVTTESAKLGTPAAYAAVPTPKLSGSSRARLKLAPLDLSQDWDPNLKSSPDLISAPTEDVDKRMAAAALWRSLNLTPEEVMHDAARLQGLEQNVQKLSDLTAQNQRQMQTLLARLEKADAQKYANPLVYGLVVALLALAGLLLWGWRRWRNADAGAPWWRGDAVEQEEPASVHESAAVSVNTGPLPATQQEPHKRPELRTQPRAPVVQALASVDIDLYLDDMLPSAVAPISRSGPMSRLPASDRPPSRMTGLRDFHSSMSGSLRSINTQEVLDVRQQAEFFMTLGQYDDAIALLENSIHDNAESNPLVYLDLLKALHTLSRKEAFDRYRDEFNALFTGQVPVYAQFSQPGRGLDAYPELCGHIASLWPSKAALEFIEKCMVREANAAAVVNFDLEAFRELLLLHAVLTRLSEVSESAMMPFSAAKAAVTEASETDAAPVAAAPMEVDFEISDLETPAPHNLIEFDAPDVSVTPPPDTRP